MIQDFTGKMRRLQDTAQHSPLVLKAMDYISIHLHSRIFLQDVADATAVSAPHLSRQFQKEMHVSISEYIAIKKIDKSKESAPIHPAAGIGDQQSAQFQLPELFHQGVSEIRGHDAEGIPPAVSKQHTVFVI